jgi:hypothetical protein
MAAGLNSNIFEFSEHQIMNILVKRAKADLYCETTRNLCKMVAV